MKRLKITIGIILFCSISTFSQWQGDINFQHFNGKVGVGTTTPLAKLEVKGGDILVRNLSNTDNSSAIMIGHSINIGEYNTFGTSLRTITESAGSNIYGMQFFTQTNYSSGQTEKMRITGNGKVGIGTTNPLAKFEVKDGDILVRNLSNADNSSAIMIGHSINIGEYNTFGTSLRTITESAGSNIYGMQFFTQANYSSGQTEKMRLTGSGNLLIGKASQQNSIYKLDVNGSIRANEIKVNLSGADFVFEDNYQLRPLNEVENYIKAHKHLPEIESAKEMEQNGTDLGALNTKLLQKIEELTLYTIEQEKKIHRLEKQVEKLLEIIE